MWVEDLPEGVALIVGLLGWILGSAAQKLWDPGQVTQLLLGSTSSSVKEDGDNNCSADLGKVFVRIT